MDHVLSSALRDAIDAWLDRVDSLVRAADTESLATLAETELPSMVAAWRALLAEHQPDEDGRCRLCTRRRRNRPAPCSIWATAHRYLVMNDVAVSGTRRHAMATSTSELQSEGPLSRTYGGGPR